MPSKKSDRRKMNPISLAFLDVMFCGFGAVILIFLILDHASTLANVESSPEITAEINLLREEVDEGQLGLVQLRNTLSDVDLEVVTAEGMARQIQQQSETFLQELAALENSSLATEESIEKLRADLRALEEERLRLQAAALRQDGNSVREFRGDGNRQYISGLYLGGQRILVLLDSSASMMDSTLLNIMRMGLVDKETGNPVFSDEIKREAPKWQRVVETVDWITTQLPAISRYQILNFNTNSEFAISGTEGRWLEVADRDQLSEAFESVKRIVPNNGTNMQQAFRAAHNMDPPPDNIFLITDGLPTLSDETAEEIGRLSLEQQLKEYVTPRERSEFFWEAVDELPPGVPINIVLMPLEGDYFASGDFWLLSQISNGALINPSSDWPGKKNEAQK